jgi:hypothetical protein
MRAQSNPLGVGLHRPIYLWAGPGTVRMNRLKFMDAPVDEAVHLEAHTPVGARRVVQEAGFNWAYLTYDWGFPPEVEREDWAAFRQAVGVYHAAGARVFGYVQASNYVVSGSFRDRDWYALDPRGRPFYYYTGRYMTCWRHPDWLEHLREMVRGVIAAGADGVFFDNPWHGAQPIHLGGAWIGGAGCYCARCREAFHRATGLEIPVRIAPETDETSRRYLRWRADLVAETLQMLADTARALKPDVLVSVNDFDAVMRPSFLIYGIDLARLSGVQDVMMIEDYGLPRWDAGTGDAAPALVNNALTLRTARALVGDTPLTTDPYDKGIGFDGVYPARRLRQGIAEAAACGAAMVVKGTEFVENGAFTLLTAERFAPQREAVGKLHRWLAEHAGLYQERTNAARVALLHPGEALWAAWDRLAPLYFGAAQTLLVAGIPWRVVTAQDDWTGLDVLFHFDQAPARIAAFPDLRAVHVPELPGWAGPAPSLLARSSAARSLVSTPLVELYRAYFRYRWARRLGDGLGLVHLFLQSPYFRLPAAPARQALLDALGRPPAPRVTAPAPVLVELWHRGEQRQLHLVNYAAAPQRVVVDLERPFAGEVLSPDRPATPFGGARVEMELDVYAVLSFAADPRGGE